MTAPGPTAAPSGRVPAGAGAPPHALRAPAHPTTRSTPQAAAQRTAREPASRGEAHRVRREPARIPGRPGRCPRPPVR
ncbi:hypothetical protein BJP39_27485 [Streptomyces sp. CC77]|nr:hypothetical protein BJP39_27485 [Streptomyces sp. CC77]